ncbi:MAG TPA: hypothetical protein VEO01_07910 [Pseudonocardiaceae bacterium]|nr:hypothetical protein [Pseudonocardiaceae bacterium]
MAAPVQTELSEVDPTRRTTFRDDIITLVAGTWLVAGIFIDGWAHNNLDNLETFFTPWHAALYSGFAACACWIAFLTRRGHVPGRSWWDSVPIGYRPAAVGVLTFLGSGAADLVWHSVFGIEQNIKALFSPSHLGLLMGAMLILSAPLVAAWRTRPTRSRPRDLAPAMASVTLTGALLAFILQQYALFAGRDFVTIAAGRRVTQQVVDGQLTQVIVPAAGTNVVIQAGLAAFLIGTVTLFTPLLLLLRRWELPAWTPLVVLVPQCVALQALDAYRAPWLLLAGVLGALVVCGLFALVRATPGHGLRLRICCSAAPVLFFGIYLGTVAIHDGGLVWSPELWGGTLVWCGLLMLGLTTLMLVPPTPLEQTESDDAARHQPYEGSGPGASRG